MNCRIFFKADDIIQYFEQPRTVLPDVEFLWASARVLVRRYASQQAYNHAMNKKLADSASDTMKVPRGTQWIPPVNNSRSKRVDDDDMEVDADEETEEVAVDESGELHGLEEFFADLENASGKKSKKKKQSKHVEASNFSGDRALANEVLFLQDMGWWIIAAHAVPEGEIGRIWEIMKVSEAV
jgi:hypothetical protein